MQGKTFGNFGLIIKERRLAKNWSVLLCARRLSIKQKQIRAIENSNIKQLPTGLRLEKIVKDYLNFLDFPADEATLIVDHWKKIDQGRRKSFFGCELIKSCDLWSYPQIIRNSLVTLVIIVAVVYIVFSLKNIFAPPKLLIISPASDVVTSQKQLSLTGQTEEEVQLEINGEPLPNDRTGYFNQLINLRLGINNLSVTAIKKYGGRTTVVRQVMVVE